MRPTIPALLLPLAVAIGGCGVRPAELAPRPNHQGIINELPGKKGYYEIVVEDGDTAANPSRSGKGSPRTIAVYFYASDGSTELSPSPSDVSIQIGGDSSGNVVPLTSAQRGRFTSAPGAYLAAFRGQLKAKIGGEPVEARFAIR
jgi:hypothetical protein